MKGIPNLVDLPLSHQVDDGWRTQAGVFDEIFMVFLVLGTIVGVIVVSYMLYNAYKYRDGGANAKDVERPTVGELPTGGTSGKKLFVSFGISAIIVVSLVAWSYTALLYVEQGPADDFDEDIEIHVNAIQFAWQFEYPNGHTATNELVIPQGELVKLSVTSTDVWHTFGSSELRIKVDAIPGQTAESWIVADHTGEYLVECFELCGTGHSGMTGEIVVVEPDEFEAWYAETEADDESSDDDDADAVESTEAVISP